MSQFISIDEEGYFLSQEIRMQDESFGRPALENLIYAENNSLQSHFDNQSFTVEAFDAPLVVQQIQVNGTHATALAPYGFKFQVDLTQLSIDEWNRIHGVSDKKIPFVLTRKAQADLFHQIDDYNDTQVCLQDKWYELAPWLMDNQLSLGPMFWSDIYKQNRAGWDLDQPAPALIDMLPRLKLPKSKILVLGCGYGHDAAFLAQHGHIVTALDYSKEAIEGARQKYGHIGNLHFVELDLFKIPHSWNESYDLIFEQTCYCAVAPSQRNDLVALWKRLLHSQGQLMGIFFANEKREGPPFGGSEWEIRERLKNHFQFLFWGRWHTSVPSRHGKELFVYAQKKNL